MKNKFLLFAISISSLLLLCFACNKEPVSQSMSSNYFPNTVGDTWTYDVTDSAEYIPGSNNSVSNYSVKVLIVDTTKLADGKEAAVWQYNYPFGIDTNYSVKVLIVGTTKLADGKEAAVWQYNYPFGIDTNYVRIVGDTIKIFDNGYYSQTIEWLKYPKLIFVQPFKVGEGWDGGHLGLDTLNVVKQEDVITSYQTFKSCFKVYYQYGGPNTELKDNYWFKPYVGVVRIYKDDFNFAPITYRTWQLKSYSVH